MPALSNLERESWERDGFVIVPGFADGATCAALWERTVAISRTADAGGDVGDAQVLLEPIPDPSAVLPEEKVGKVFRLHHEPGVHADLAHDPGLGDLLGDLLGEDVDCFLSQFIFKNRRSLGQPLHQDAWYFRMTPSDQVGAWLAVTEATLENGPLWVLPGSHREPLHDVESDRRPGAQLGYVEITDHDIDGAIPVLLDPGDLLLFHAHLMHRSTDNFTEAPRAAMVYHFGSSGTHDPAVDPDPASLAGYLRDLGMEVEEPLAPSVEAAVRANVRNRWLPLRRAGRPVGQPLTRAEDSGS